MAETQTPIPQALSSEVAKAATLPDVLKYAPINWEKVRKVDQGLDNIPEIHARGAVIKVEKQVDVNDMREGTKIKVGREETNLVDHVLQDEQLRTLMQEGMRLGIVTEADFKAIGVGPEMYLKGEKAGLKIPELDRLQKVESINLILQHLGDRVPATGTLAIDEMSKLVLDAKNVKFLGEVGGALDNQDLMNALVAGGREELSKYIVETGYQPYSMAEKNLPERRILAKLVRKSYGKEGAGRVLSDETPYFAESGLGKEKSPVAEYSGVVDLHIAQAMTNAMMPPEFHVTIAGLEGQVRASRDVSEIADLQHQITQTRQKAYAALLNAFGVEGFQIDGQALKDFGFSAQEQLDVDRIAKTIKESSRFKETQNMTLFEANRFSLAETTARITNLSPSKLKGIVLALPIEQTVETLREKARANFVSEDGVESTVRKQLARDFVRMVSDLNVETVKKSSVKEDRIGRLSSQESSQTKRRGLNKDQRDQLEKFFLSTYDTERSLIRKGGQKRFKDADAPTKMKIGTREAINQGVKGLELLFKRSISEAQYNYETYKKLVIEGVANPPEPVNGAVLEQGEQKEVADKTKVDADELIKKARDEAEAEAERARVATDSARTLEIENQKALAEEQAKEAATTAARQARLPEQSLNLNVTDDMGGQNELYYRIDHGELSSGQILVAVDRVIGVPTHFKGIFRRGAEALNLTDKNKAEVVRSLRDAQEYALQVEERRRLEAQQEQERATRLREAEALLNAEGRRVSGREATAASSRISVSDRIEQADEIKGQGGGISEEQDDERVDIDAARNVVPFTEPLADDADIPTFLKNK